MFIKSFKSTKLSWFVVLIILFTFQENYSQNPEWINYSSDNWVSSIAEEGEYLWAGSRAGLYKINKTTGEKELFTSADGLPGLSVFIAIDAQGNKWFGGSGLANFDGTEWTYSPFKYAGQPFIDRSNRLWIRANPWVGIDNYVLYTFDGQTWENYTEDNSILPSNYTGSMTQDDKGNLWIVVGDSKLLKIDRDDVWTLYEIPFEEAEFSHCYDIAVDAAGTVWLASEYSGDEWKRYTLVRFDGRYWEFYHTDELPFNSAYVWAVAVDRLNHLWVGFHDGLAEFDGNSWFIYNDKNSVLSNRAVRHIFIDEDNNKWVHESNNGLVRYDGQTWTVYPLATAPYGPGFNYNDCESIVLDREDNAWMIESGVLVRFDGREWTVFNPPNGIFSHYNYQDLIGIDERDHIWINDFVGSDANTLVCFDGSIWHVFPDTFSTFIRAIAFDEDDIVWLGSAGLIQYDVSENKIVNTFNKENSELPSNDVDALLLVKDVLWIGT